MSENLRCLTSGGASACAPAHGLYIIHWTQGRSLQGAAQGVLIVQASIYSFHWFFENEESRTVSVLFLVRVVATRHYEFPSFLPLPSLPSPPRLQQGTGILYNGWSG